MGLPWRKKKEEAEPKTTAAARGVYDVDEHHLTPQEVAARFGTQIDWKNVQGSKGLSKEQVQKAVASVF